MREKRNGMCGKIDKREWHVVARNLSCRVRKSGCKTCCSEKRGYVLEGYICKCMTVQRKGIS